MKSKLARLLFAYLSRVGLVLCAVDPGSEAPAADGGTPAAATDTSAAAGDAGDTGGTAGDDPQGSGDATNPATVDPAKAARDRELRKLERRIGERTRALGARDQEIAQLRAQLEARAPAANDDPNDDPAADVETRAREIARETIRREEIATRTRAMLEKGKAIPGFRELALDVAADLPFVDAKGRPTPFIEAVLESDEPHALLHHIHTHDLAATLVGLSERQLGRRLALLEVEAKKPTPTRSNAARPLDPVNGRGDASRDPAAMTDEQWRASRFAKRKA